MKMKTLRMLTYASLVCLSLVSCIKEDPLGLNDDSCAQLAAVRATPFTPVLKGEEIIISAGPFEGANYYWTGPNNFQSYSQTNSVASYADYFNRGWYYVNVTLDGCDSRFDSVYVDVNFPQGSAACSPDNNSASFDGPLLLGDQSYYSVSFGAAVYGYGITGNSSNGDMSITMSGYWITNDFEDGIYYTTNDPLPDYSDLDKLHISNVNQSIYWSAEPGKPVYISHVGGKRRITFCDVRFTGDWGGTLYETTVDAQITQP